MSLRERPAVALFAATVLLMALVGTAVVLVSPTTALPVGISMSVGDSMGHAEPQVVVYGPALDGYDTGDVVAFHSESGWILHQLVRETSQGWITKGTNEPHTDQWSGGPGSGISPVQRSQIAGVQWVAIPISWATAALVGLLIGLCSLRFAGTRGSWRTSVGTILSAVRAGGSRLVDVDRQTAAALGLSVLVLVSVLASFPVGASSSTTSATATGAGSQKWSAIGADVKTSPTIVDGTVYVGASDDNVYALDASDGSVKWTYNSNGWPFGALEHANGVLYGTNLNNYVYAIDATDGSKVWNISIGGSGQTLTSPAYKDGTVYVAGGDQQLHALDAADGSTQWTYDTGSSLQSSPVVVNGTVYFGDDSGTFHAVDASSGSKKWTYNANYRIKTAPTVADGKIFFTDGGTTGSGRIFALNTNGSLAWKSSTQYAASSSGPTVKGDKLYVGGDDDTLRALYTRNGTEAWSHALSFIPEGPHPTIAGGTVYIGDNDGYVYAVNADEGTRKWRYSAGGEVKGSPTVADGTVYVGSNTAGVTAIGTDHTASSSGTRNLLKALGHTSGYGAGGQPVSGHVYDQHGNALTDASLTLKNTSTGSVIATTTTNSSGGYKFSGVSDGSDYQIEASAPGYRSDTTPTFGISGAPRTFDLKLKGSTLVKVRDQSGDPVSYATVQAVAWNNTTFTGTRQEIQNRIEKLEANISDPLPDSWRGRDYSVQKEIFAKTNERAIALHRSEDWIQGAGTVVYPNDLVISNGQVTAINPDPVGQLSNNPRLRRPKLAFEPDERIWVTCVDGSKSGTLQNDVDSDFQGAAAVSCDANITQLAGSDALSEPVTVKTKQVWSTIGPGGDEYAGVIDASALGPGVYRVEPASGDGIAYSFVIAPNRDAGSIRRNIVTDLKNEKGKLTDKAQELQNLAEQDKLQVKRVQTDKYGRARIALDKGNVARVTAIAYKRPAGFDASDFSDLQVSEKYPTQQDITRWYELKTDEFRQNLESGNEEFASLACNGISNATGSTAVPAGVASGKPPTSITVEVRTVGRPDYLPSTDKLCAQADLVEFLESQGLGDQIPGFLQDVEDMSPAEIRAAYRNVSSLISQNAEACKQALRNQGLDSDISSCTAGENNTPKDENNNGVVDSVEEDIEEETGVNIGDGPDGEIPDEAVEEIRDRLDENRQAIEEVQDTIGNDPPTVTPGDSNETVSLEFPFDTDLAPGQVAVFVDYANGTTETLGVESEYVEIDGGVGGDTVRLVDYPLGSSDAAVANFRVNVATPEGTGSASKAVRNPTYTGTIPQLSSIRVSSLTPGVNETVQLGVNGKPGTGFGSTEALRVTFPNGTTTTLGETADGEASFTPTARGTHRVEAVFSPAGGSQNFTETVLVTARNTDVPRPPSIRPQSGPTGRYTVVSQAYQDGSIESDANGRQIEIAGNVRANSDVPDTTHLYLSGVDRAPKAQLDFRMTKGPDKKAVTQSSRVVMHLGTLQDDAILYRGGAPLQVGGETPAGVVKQTNGSWTLSTYTDENGQVEVHVNNDPGWGDRAGYWIDLFLSTGATPFLGLGVPYHPATGALGWLLLIGAPSGALIGIRRRWFS